MFKLDSVINMRNFILSKGFDVIPVKKANNEYKAVVFRGEKCMGEGKIIHKTWQTALERTEESIYKKIKQN